MFLNYGGHHPAMRQQHVDKKSHKNSTNNNRYFSSFHKNNPKKKRPISLQVNCETNPEKHSLLNFISIMNMSVWWHTTKKKCITLKNVHYTLKREV